MIFNNNLQQLLKLPREKRNLKELSDHYTADSGKCIFNCIVAESNTKHHKFNIIHTCYANPNIFNSIA